MQLPAHGTAWHYKKVRLLLCKWRTVQLVRSCGAQQFNTGSRAAYLRTQASDPAELLLQAQSSAANLKQRTSCTAAPVSQASLP